MTSETSSRSVLPGAHPVLSCADAMAWEQSLLGGDESREWAAMSQAGRALAAAVLEDAREAGGIPDDGRLLVLCGKGHNGGDALIALHVLLSARARATALVIVVPGFSRLRPLVRRAVEDVQRAHAARITWLEVAGGPDGRDAARVREALGNEACGMDPCTGYTAAVDGAAGSPGDAGPCPRQPQPGGSGPSEPPQPGRSGPRWAGAAAFDLCLDGLFGMQFRPPLRSPADWLLELVNAARGIRLRAAVDVPSGTGDENGTMSFVADFTYATGIAKRPVLTSSAGRLRYLDLGFFGAASLSFGAASASRRPTTERDRDFVVGRPLAGALDTCATGPNFSLFSRAKDYVLTRGVLAGLRGLRDAGSDKRTYGHLFVVSGSRTMPGAVLMAVESALLSGVGLVTAFVPESLATAFAARLPEAMWVPMPETPGGGLALEGRGSVVARAARCTGLLIGPGLGHEPESLALVHELLRAIDVPTVLDADALQANLVAVRSVEASSPRVLTPHAGEFARIAGDAGSDPREFARRSGCTLVLKGAPTRLTDGGPLYVSPFGGPVLARGGSGDVLAGLLGGQLAQGADALETAARAVVWHGLAADSLARAGGQTSARVTNLCHHLGSALMNLAHDE